jgi:hypothetical protein
MQEVVGEVLLDDVALVAAADDEVHPVSTGNNLPPSPMLVIHFFNGRREQTYVLAGKVIIRDREEQRI